MACGAKPPLTGIGTASPFYRLSFGAPANGSRTIALYENGATGGFYGLGNDVNRLAFYTGNATASVAERMAIDHAGNVGIGTTNPRFRLEVSGSIINTAAYNANNNLAGYDVGVGSVGALTSVYSYGRICSGNSMGSCAGANGVVIGGAALGSVQVNITTGHSYFNGGNVAIGTTTHSGKLRVYTTANEPGILVQNVGGGNYAMEGQATSNYGIYGRTLSAGHGGVLGYDAQQLYYGILGHANAFSFYGNGDAYISGSYQGSDARLKENIRPLVKAVDLITKLKPVAFEWRRNTDQARTEKHKQHYGLIAQDVLPVVPEAVTSVQTPKTPPGHAQKPKTLNEELGTTYGVDYTTFVPILLKAVQELKAANDNLTVENATLKAGQADIMRRLEALERRNASAKAAK